MTRYFFVILLMALIGIAIVVKAGITMFAERQYWQDVADRFVKENVTVKPNRGNIISSDGKLMASSLPEYRIYMDMFRQSCLKGCQGGFVISLGVKCRPNRSKQVGMLRCDNMFIVEI